MLHRHVLLEVIFVIPIYIMRTKLDIYVFIAITESIPLLVDYLSPRVSCA